MEALVRAVNSFFFYFTFFFFKGTVLAIVEYRKTNGELERKGWAIKLWRLDKGSNYTSMCLFCFCC